jgi:hypothetical protein
MQSTQRTTVMLGLVGLAAAAAWMPTDAKSNGGARTHDVEMIEQATSFAFLDTAAGDSALGDQLVGSADLLDVQGRKLGTSSFHCVSTNAVPRTSEICSFVYTLPGGRITTSGEATLSAGTPIFDEAFAVTGGTGIYQRVRGEVRVRQDTTQRALVTLRLRP